MVNTMIKNIVLLAFGSCVGLFQLSQLASFNQDSTVSLQEAALLETSKHKDELVLSGQLPRFGFKNIRADLSFISFLQYFGNDELRKQNGYGLSPDFFESVIENDPYYTDFYVFLTNSVSLNAAQPERSAELMNKGLASLEEHRLDNSFYVWRYKGVDELLFLDDANSARHSFEKAAEWASESSLPEGKLIASISQQTADFIGENPDSKAAQIGAWSSVLSTAIDDDTRNRAVESIRALGGDVVIGEDGRVAIKYAEEEQNTES